MVKPEVRKIIQKYLKSLSSIGIHPTKAILYGSFAREKENEWSDIDLVVVAPEFDEEYDYTLVMELWAARGNTDSRLEPIPCGMRE